MNVFIIVGERHPGWPHSGRHLVRETDDHGEQKYYEGGAGYRHSTGGLLTVARDTATSSESAAVAARETVSAATAARAAAERDRKAQRLRHIAELVEQIFEKAAAADGRTRPAWRCIEQRELPPLLVSAEQPLPKCDHLAGSSQADLVFAAAVDARTEIAERLRQLHADDEAAPQSNRSAVPRTRHTPEVSAVGESNSRTKRAAYRRIRRSRSHPPRVTDLPSWS